MHDLVEPSTGIVRPGASSGQRRRTFSAVVGVALAFGVAAGFVVGLLVTRVGGDGPVGHPGAEGAAALVGKGLQLHVDGDLTAAADQYRQAIALDPASVLAHYNLGLVHQSEGRVADAEREYRRTIDLDPAYAPALFNLGVLASAAGDNDQAITYYRRAVKDDPKFAGAQFNLGLSLLKAGDVNGGNAAIQIAIRLDPSLANRIEKGAR